MSRTTKYFKQEPNNRAFGNSTHTSWEAFQHTMKTEAYQTVISGGKFHFRNSSNSAAARFTTGSLPPVNGRGTENSRVTSPAQSKRESALK